MSSERIKEDSIMKINAGIFIRVALLLGSIGCGSAAIAAEPVAMVTDIEGRATLAEGAAKHELSILSELKAGARLRLENGARVAVVYLGTGQEYELNGPAVVRIAAGQPEAVSGTRPKKGGVALAKGGSEVRIKPVVVSQAAIVMRSSAPGSRLKLLSLSGTKTLDTRPVFQWQPPQPGLHYQVELMDDTGKTILTATTGEAALALPAQIELKEAADYTWMVSTVLPDGSKYSNVGDFSIAPQAVREQAEKLRPANDATVSERVEYASWLEQMELRDEARKYWKSVAAERQGHGKIKEVIGE
jgi:hypothetical protein